MVDVDGEVTALYRASGLDPEDPPSPYQLARRLTGAEVVRQRRARHAAWVGSLRQIWIPAGWSEGRVRWAIAHELGEWHLDRCGYYESDVERLCQQLAGALLAPAALVRNAYRAIGRDLPALSSGLQLSESASALRLAEVTGQPTVLVTDRHIHVRGELWNWPGETTLRRWARDGADGVEREALTDAPRRAVLRPED